MEFTKYEMEHVVGKTGTLEFLQEKLEEAKSNESFCEAYRRQAMIDGYERAMAAVNEVLRYRTEVG